MDPRWVTATEVLLRFRVDGGRAITAFVDPDVDADLVHDRLDRLARATELALEVVPADEPRDLAVLHRAARGRRAPRAVVAVGGGTVLDHAKLVAAVQDHPDLMQRIVVPQRCGLVQLTAPYPRRAPLVAVPTTLGTGAEVSPVATVETDGAKRLVLGSQLRPDAYVHDDELTATLPADLVADGAFEAFLRIVGPYVGSATDVPVADAMVLALARTCWDFVGEARAAALAGRGTTAELRLGIATASVVGHSEVLRRPGSPFSTKAWYVGNEIMTELGLRKTRALALVVPAIWDRIAAGDDRWGDARHLDILWRHLRASGRSGFDTSPAEGLAAAVDAWGLVPDVRLDGPLADAIAHRVVRAWGAGLPMLAGISHADIRALLGAEVSGGDQDLGSPHGGARLIAHGGR